MRLLVIQITCARNNFVLVLTGRSPRRKSHRQVSVRAGLSMPKCLIPDAILIVLVVGDEVRSLDVISSP